MAIVSFAGLATRFDDVARILEREGYLTSFEIPLDAAKSGSGAPGDAQVARISSKEELLVGVIAVFSPSGGEPPINRIRSSIERIKDEQPLSAKLLLVNHRQARQITWMHDGNECVAEVGTAMRWRKYFPMDDEFGPWSFGKTVWLIEPGPLIWKVNRNPLESADGWHNTVLCGDQVEVQWFEFNPPS